MGDDVSIIYFIFYLKLTGTLRMLTILSATMVWGAVAMALELLIGGILDKYAAENGPHQKAYGAGVATMTFLYTATFGATWLTTPWLYPTEIFPLNVRAKGGAWSVVGWSIGNGIVTMVRPTKQSLSPALPVLLWKSQTDIPFRRSHLSFFRLLDMEPCSCYSA